MKILLVHGVGHAESTDDYYVPWKNAITAGLTSNGFRETIEFVDFNYDHAFEKHYSGPGVYAAALAELAATTLEHAIADPIHDFIQSLLHPSRDFTYFGQTIRWHAGMVAQFAIESDLRTTLRDRLSAVLTAETPDLVAAHSLGSLLTFDFLRNDPRAKKIPPFTYLTFGSQINNVFIRSRLWAGRIVMPGVRSWIHLYNEQDKVFTANIAVADAANFQTILTPSAAGHSPVTTAAGPGYLDHPNTLRSVWATLAQPAAARSFSRSNTIANRALAKPRRRALIIGINDYPDPQNCLEGCVNDAFLFSSVLQERGFAAEDIRMVLNERATASAIRERLTWLLEDVGDGMERVLFYSGHGAQLPGYNAAETVDHVDECLVPYDFAWTKESAITDDDFYRLYSELPFSARFFAVFDCCHAGGITRDGGRKVRGITPPDDIRHRLLEWNAKEQMWLERDLNPINGNYGGTEKERDAMMGENQATFKLGRGMKLRRHTSKIAAKRLVKEKQGIYLPVLIEACGEGQLSYEYRHGTVSYGAFTYSMAKNLRAAPTSSFSQVVARTTETLKTLGYDQTPQLIGPSKIIRAAVPNA